MGFWSVPAGGSGGRVFAVGRGQWRAGAESGAGAGGELIGVSRGRQTTPGRAPMNCSAKMPIISAYPGKALAEENRRRASIAGYAIE